MLVHSYNRILLIYRVCVWGGLSTNPVSLENIMLSEKVILKGSYKMLFYLPPSEIVNHAIRMQIAVLLWFAISGIINTKEKS